MAPTPSAKSNQSHSGNVRTPQSKHRLNFNVARPSPNPHSAAGKEAPLAEHPVEVLGRIRDYPDRKEKPPSALKLNTDRQSLRVKTDIGYRDFHLDGVSFSEEEDLDLFYKKFVEARINGVKLGAKCTIMMYGPTGAGKSHTMFGSSKHPGIVYRSLKDILGEGDEVSEENSENPGVGTFVQVTVLEIYNEEIYDLLSTNTGGGFGFGWSKGNASKVRLEIMGKRAKNATFISGNDAGSLSKEIQKVEKRRIVKSTLSNDRSSRSHCMIILDVPTVGGRLMLVDMAGSENIEQAGQNGFEAKMQTAKINQGNIALKRVVESIANGDSHVPFRDSKLTMLLQDSFEDDKSKILMILCASPDPKELYKTISTLEYGAKAKCIVRGPSTPIKDKGADDSSSADVLGSRIAAMDQFIYKLQTENKLREKEKNEAQKELRKKEEEISALRAKLAAAEGKSNAEEVNIKVKEQTMMMKSELEKKIQECQQMANKFVEMERRKMEERMLQQQQEVDLLRRRLEEIEFDLRCSKGTSGSADLGESRFAARMLEVYSDDSDMVKSMDLSKSYDMETIKRDAGVYRTENSNIDTFFGYNNITNPTGDEDVVTDVPTFTNKVSLSTVFEEEEEEEGEDNKCSTDEEVKKEVVEEKTICSSTVGDVPDMLSHIGNLLLENSATASRFIHEDENAEDAASFRERRIQNIFTLCGNYRETSQNMRETPMLEQNKFDSSNLSSSPPAKTIQEYSATKSISNDLLESDNPKSEHKSAEKNMNLLFEAKDLKENFNPSVESSRDLEVYVKWTPSKENQKDPSGAPVPKEQEARTSTGKLPTCNNNHQLHGHLNQLPLGQVQNLLPVTPNSHIRTPVDGF